MRLLRPFFRSRRAQLQRGFSLLEAVVAMAIAAIAFGALFRTVGQSSKVAGDVDGRVEAQLLAQSILASAAFAEDLEPLHNGQEGPWQWQLQVSAEPVAWELVDGMVDTREDALMAPQMVARIDIQVRRAGAPAATLTWQGYKPYRALP